MSILLCCRRALKVERSRKPELFFDPERLCRSYRRQCLHQGPVNRAAVRAAVGEKEDFMWLRRPGDDQ